MYSIFSCFIICTFGLPAFGQTLFLEDKTKMKMVDVGESCVEGVYMSNEDYREMQKLYPVKNGTREKPVLLYLVRIDDDVFEKDYYAFYCYYNTILSSSLPNYKPRYYEVNQVARKLAGKKIYLKINSKLDCNLNRTGVQVYLPIEMK